jgi:hypothetical protein
MVIKRNLERGFVFLGVTIGRRNKQCAQIDQLGHR